MFSKDTLNRLYRYAYSLTGNEADAYDLLQESLTRFLEQSSSPAPDKPVFYLQRIMRNRFIDQLRRAKRYPLEALDGTEYGDAGQAFNELERLAISQQTLETIWQRLSPLERELMHLWALEEYTAQEIADLIQSNRSTVLSRIHRLRKKIASLADDADTFSNRGHEQ